MTSPAVYWRNQSTLVGQIGRLGTILSWTIIRVAPADFMNQAPYPVVLVKLANGSKLTAQLVDSESKHLRVGQKVVCVLRKTFTPGPNDLVPYSLKFKPA